MMRLEVTKNLVNQYTAFRKVFNVSFATIYYPSSGPDISPTSVFPDSRVIYADKERFITDALKSEGLEAYCADANQFQIQNGVDAVILQNPQIRVTNSLLNLKTGGYVLCNDYHGSATEIKAMDSFKQLAMVRADRNSEKLIVDKTNFEDYWREVETDKEFMNASVGFMRATYENALEIVRELTGQEHDIVKNYQRIRENRISEQLKEFNAIRSGLGTPTTMPIFINISGDMRFLSELPRKIGNVDDLFVFVKSA